MITIVGKTVVGTYVTYKYVGSSKDEKPMASNGSKFEEMDTGDEYFFDGDEQGWTKKADKYLDSLEITTAPTKVEYVDGDEFDATGMVVKAKYTDNTSATISEYEVIASSPLTPKDTSITVKYSENGRTRSVEQEIAVVAVALSSIAFTTNPTKTAYYVGDELDLTGASITATYNNGDTADVTEQCTFTPEDGAFLSADDTTVTASFTDGEVTKTATASITVTPIALSSIAFTANPTKTSYQDNETLDLTGAVVTATYNNGDTADVTSDCTFSPENGAQLTVSDTSVTASYTEDEVTKTASIGIEVVPR